MIRPRYNPTILNSPGEYNLKTSTQLNLITAFSLTALLPAEPTLAADCAIEPSTNKMVSYEFNDTELSSAVMLAGLAAGKEIIGLELLEDKIITASAKEVNVVAFIDALLLVNGFDFTELQDSWVITKM